MNEQKPSKRILWIITGQFCLSNFVTGKFFSEALIFALTNPQYDNRLLIESPVQYMKIPSLENVVYTNCFLFWYSEQFMYTTCSELGIFMYWTGDSMNNILSYFGLVEVRISASEKDLPVPPVPPVYFVLSTQFVNAPLARVWCCGKWLEWKGFF